MAHTWQLKYFTYSILDIPWRLTHLLLSLEYFKNTATNTKFSNILFCSTQADFIPLTIRYFSYLNLTGLTDYININKQLKEAKQFYNADDGE